MGNFAYPGSYYLDSTTDDDIAGEETIFTGYWVGNAYRPGKHPVVICPYVLVPGCAINKEGCDGETKTKEGKEMTSNGTDPAKIHAGLGKHLTQSDGSELRACYNIFDEDGRFSPEQRMS